MRDEMHFPEDFMTLTMAVEPIACEITPTRRDR
jgi:hypothetical protein